MAWWVEMLNETKGKDVQLQEGITYCCGTGMVVCDVFAILEGTGMSPETSDAWIKSFAYGVAAGLWGYLHGLRIDIVMVEFGGESIPVVIPPPDKLRHVTGG